MARVAYHRISYIEGIVIIVGPTQSTSSCELKNDLNNKADS